MTEYEVRGFNSQHKECGHTVQAKDIRDAIAITKKECPELIHLTSVLPTSTQ